MTLKELQAEQHRIDCSKTSMRPDYVPVTKFSDKTERGLIKCIEAFISIKGGIARRINTVGRYLPGKTVGVGMYGNKTLPGKYIPTTSVLGAADLSILINGIAWECEIKIGKDRQSQVQKEYEQKIVKSGGVYTIVRDFDEFVEQYKEIVGRG